MANRFRLRAIVTPAALVLAGLLGGCVAYPAYPGYGYGGPYYGGGYIGGGGGWDHHGGWGHEGGWDHHGGWGHEGGWRR